MCRPLLLLQAAALLLLLPQHTVAQFPVAGMSDDCLQDLCEVYKTLTTCPVFNIEWDGVCSEYLLGYLYQCPDYPSADEIYEAPSVCLQQYLGIIMQLKMGQKPINPTMVAAGSYSEYCYENCYQNYIDQTEAYNENCAEYLSANFTQVALSLNAFRGVSCGETNYTDPDTNVNCYDALQEMQSEGSGGPSPLSDFTCTLYNETMYPSICTNFSQNECCFGNQNLMLGQALMNPIPPCLNKYCKDIAPVTEICPRHINFATGSVEASVYLDFAPDAGLPNMYVNVSVLRFQAGLMTPLGLSPLMASIFDFTYYAGGVAITDNSPTALATATSGNFSFLVSVVGSTEQQIQTITATLNSDNYALALQGQVFQGAGAVTVRTDQTRFYESDQIYTSAASFSSPVSVFTILGAAVISMYFAF
jgi:hypothetical protein